MLRLTMHGTLGGDAEIRHLDGGRSVISFSVAHSDKWTDAQGNKQERTTWVKCSLWRKSDQVGVAQYLTKGSKVYVEGNPSARAYMNNQGQPTASLEITVTNVELGGGGQRQAQTHQQQQQQQASAPVMTSNFMDDDSLPF